MGNEVENYLEMNSQVVRSKEQVTASLMGQAVMLNVKTGKYYSLNSVGSRIWELLEQPISVQYLYQKILNEYQVDNQRCEEDTFHLLYQLHQAGLIEIFNNNVDRLS
jgi:hypothetical protein